MSYKIIEERKKGEKTERHTYRADITTRDRALHLAERREQYWRERGDDRRVIVRAYDNASFTFFRNRRA